MKIHQLPMGARFSYQGQDYTKTGPQLASGPDGQRLIPKYAILQPYGTPAAAPADSAQTLSRAQVLTAFELYHAHCLSCVTADQHAALATARADFLRALD